MIKREPCVELIEKLLKTYTLEELGTKCGVSASTVYYWKNGRAVPMLAAKMLRGMR